MATRSVRVTITDVCAAAGVSAATVSRVLNGTAKVDAALAARVHDAVRELGYRPNAAAQGLARGEAGTVGVLVPDLANPYFADVLKAVSAAARAHGRRMVVTDSDEDAAVEHDLVEELLRSCDGVLLCSPRMDLAQLTELVARDRPIVLFNRVAAGLAVPSITADFVDGMAQLRRHLGAMGHRRVAYLSGPSGSWANSERLRALRADPDLDVAVVACGATGEHGYRAAAAALETAATAIVGYNDLVALGALAKLRELGVRVPDDVTVTGFDDISLDRVAHSDLTTVSGERHDMGRRAAEMLEQRMTAGHHSDTAQPQVAPMHLRVRATSGPPRAAHP